MEQHHVSRAEGTVLFLPGDDPFLLDERAAALRRRVEKVAAIDDARLAAELPGCNLVAEGFAERPGVGQPRIGQRDRMWWKVELRAGVAVDRQDVAVVGAHQPKLLVVVDLKKRPILRGPGTGKIGRN